MNLGLAVLGSIMIAMTASNELGEFLRSRRARLNPAEVGLRGAATSRRVAGLRREELAMLAGVSADYYARLEQGRARNVSEQVLTAVADALQLDDVERRHLNDLAHQSGAATHPAPKVRAALRSMVHALDPVPAVLHGPLLEVLAINRAGKALITDFDAMPAAERNMVRWMFLDPNARRVYPDWAEIAAQMVAILRAAGNGPALAELVGELTAQSPEFARCWAEYRVYQHTYGPKRFHHDEVGTMVLNYETLRLPADPGLSVILYTADTGSPSAQRLTELVSSYRPSR